MPARHPSGVSDQAPLPQGVGSEVLVMTGMAAQGERPGEHVSQMAQMLFVPVLVNGKAHTVRGSCF